MTLASDCLELIKKKLAREIGSDEFYCAIMELENKYPAVGFKQAAEQYANKLRQIIKKESKHLSVKQIDRKMAAAGDYEEEVPF